MSLPCGNNSDHSMNHHDNHHVDRDDKIIEGRQHSPSTDYLKSSPPLHERRDSTEYISKTAVATPSPTNHQRSPGQPEPVSILATSSPEIETLQMSSFDFFDGSDTHNSLKRNTSAATVLEDTEFTTSNSNAMTVMDAKTPAACKRHVPRVSLSPPRDFNSPGFSFGTIPDSETSSVALPSFDEVRSPLDDITKSLCRVRLSTPSTARSTPSTVRSTPTSSARGPSIRKPTLHRRVSFDTLPSPSEYAGAAGCTPLKNTQSASSARGKYSPVKAARSVSMSNIPTGYSPSNKGRRHRRNTTVIMLSSAHK